MFGFTQKTCKLTNWGAISNTSWRDMINLYKLRGGPLTVTVTKKCFFRDSVLKMVHNPGGHWHPVRGPHPIYKYKNIFFKVQGGSPSLAATMKSFNGLIGFP